MLHCNDKDKDDLVSIYGVFTIWKVLSCKSLKSLDYLDGQLRVKMKAYTIHSLWVLEVG